MDNNASDKSKSDEIKRLKNELKNNVGNLSTLDIIGKSKELFEATFKVICDKKGIGYSKDDSLYKFNGQGNRHFGNVVG